VDDEIGVAKQAAISKKYENFIIILFNSDV
jgi:hypothetical protein